MDLTGDAIRRARQARGLSQADLAAATGVGARTIARMEAGTRVDDRKLLPVARYLGLTDDADDGSPPQLSDAELVARIRDLRRQYDTLVDQLAERITERPAADDAPALAPVLPHAARHRRTRRDLTPPAQERDQ